MSLILGEKEKKREDYIEVRQTAIQQDTVKGLSETVLTNRNEGKDIASQMTTKGHAGKSFK